MKTLIILMFIMLIVLLALNVTLYLNFNKRLNNLRSLCSGGFNQFSENFNRFNEDTASVYNHINSIYQTIKDLMNTVSKFKTVLDGIELKSSDRINHLTAYIHQDNDTHKKELINCMTNSFTDMRKYISDTISNIKNDKILNAKKEILLDIKEYLISIQKALGDTNFNDIKVVSNEELAKISSMLKDTQNWCNCISKQIEACNKLKTATKSKSIKSDKPDAKKKTPLL